MAKEYKRIELPASTNGQMQDELERLQNEGWDVKRWSFNAITNRCTYCLEREIPDHEQKRT